MGEVKEIKLWKYNYYLSIIVSALFFAYWVIYCAHLIQHWHEVDQKMQIDIQGLAAYSLALWILLLMEKANWLIMMMTCIFFIVASRLALHLF